MKESITTQGIQNKVKNIAEEFVVFVNSNKTFHDTNGELMLLLNKISSNIQAAMLLSSRMLFSESKIIIRSAFETLILFIYLIEFPKEINHYKEDNLISEIKTIYMCYKQGFAKLQDVINCYEKYKNKFLLKILPFEKIDNKEIKNNNEKEIEKYFNSHKPLSQKTTFMIGKLKERNYFLSNHLSLLRVLIYNLNSEVTHSRLDTLFLPLGNLNKDETLKELQNCFWQSASLLHSIIEVLKEKCDYQPPEKLKNLILETMQYLKIYPTFNLYK